MAFYIPIMMDCEGLRIVVVGGGAVATRRIASLLEGKALITVISPTLNPELETRHAAGHFIWIDRVYQEGDLAEINPGLVYACTDEHKVNRQVALEAKARNLPVNVATAPEEGSFITPAVFRRGELVVGVTASGAGPAIARTIAADLKEFYGEEYELYVAWHRAVRDRIKSQVEDPARRKLLLEKLANLNLLEQIRSGQFERWTEQQIDEWIVKG